MWQTHLQLYRVCLVQDRIIFPIIPDLYIIVNKPNNENTYAQYIVASKGHEALTMHSKCPY